MLFKLSNGVLGFWGAINQVAVELAPFDLQYGGFSACNINAVRGCYSAPVPAVGVIAIGQFAAGLVSISQCGIGLLSISQFTIAGFAIAQFAIAWEMIAQFGLSIQNLF